MDNPHGWSGSCEAWFPESFVFGSRLVRTGQDDRVLRDERERGRSTAAARTAGTVITSTVSVSGAPPWWDWASVLLCRGAAW
ncbi:hypothetical protein [Streptomyces sp. TS71-3]|uniref:hypothetical protein n=1 Tax=Streptomyces sp. TS71-3 TaxID=2733862 RepID=UPI001BB2F3BB|nr:hypothetical protein [Streptomyces sp. TS71-3]